MASNLQRFKELAGDDLRRDVREPLFFNSNDTRGGMEVLSVIDSRMRSNLRFLDSSANDIFEGAVGDG